MLTGCGHSHHRGGQAQVGVQHARQVGILARVAAGPVRGAAVGADTDSVQFPHSRENTACASIPRNPYFFLLPLVGLNPQTARDSLRNPYESVYTAPKTDADPTLTEAKGADTLPKLERGHGAAGSASEWHSEGQRFDPAWLHQDEAPRDVNLRVLHLYLQGNSSSRFRSTSSSSRLPDSQVSRLNCWW